jgi:hypothetical protein
MFHSGWVHTCDKCKGQWDFGFFNNKKCPKCTGIGKQILSLIGRIVRVALILGVPFAIVYACDNDMGSQVASRAVRVLDSRTFYTYGKDAYLAEIRYDEGKDYYTLKTDVPAYTRPVAQGEEGGDALADILKKGTIVRIGQEFKRAGEYWAPVEYYVGKSMRCAFVLEENPVTTPWSTYDIKSRQAVALKEYQAFVLKNFATVEKKALSEEEAKARGVFALEDVKPAKGAFAYATLSDKGEIAKARKWFTASENVDMTVLQQDEEFKREPLAIKAGGKGEL